MQAPGKRREKKCFIPSSVEKQANIDKKIAHVQTGVQAGFPHLLGLKKSFLLSWRLHYTGRVLVIRPSIMACRRPCACFSLLYRTVPTTNTPAQMQSQQMSYTRQGSFVEEQYCRGTSLASSHFLCEYLQRKVVALRSAAKCAAHARHTRMESQIYYIFANFSYSRSALSKTHAHLSK